MKSNRKAEKSKSNANAKAKAVPEKVCYAFWARAEFNDSCRHSPLRTPFAIHMRALFLHSFSIHFDFHLI